MKYRLVVFGVLAAVVALASVPVKAQAQRTASSTAARTYTPPQTAWGDPDLQGIWRQLHQVPFERPAQFEGREFRTDAEIAALERDAEQADARKLSGKGENTGHRNQLNYNAIVGYTGEKARFSRRTSAIIDPPDGRLPPWTLEQVKRYEAREAVTLGRGEADWTVDRPSGERCFPVLGPPVLGAYGMGAGVANRNNPRQDPFLFSPGTPDVRRILQAPGYVARTREEGFMEELTIIPLDGRPHLSSTFKQWQGDVRGHWEGDTLVVETTNLKYPYPIITSYGGAYPGDGETLRFTERFKRVGQDTIEYTYTVDDPAVYTRPYTVRHELTRDDDYKVAAPICIEGHDDMPSTLAAGRNDEESSIDNANDAKLEREPRLKQVKEAAIKAAAEKNGNGSR